MITLDGRNLNSVAEQGTSDVFNFTMPAHDNYLQLPGRTQGRMAVYGDATILRPLSPGMHTLVQLDSFAGFSGYKQTTYELRVS